MRYKLYATPTPVDANATGVMSIDDAGMITFIPASEENSDYVEYLAWVAAGNTPEPAES